ncbi:hypothetical protein [Streptomyces sp. ISL-11]|uniref:hypothetical protein n=1 Tax=Streptomyces sp. ISL-11 TaxID=2819174 RepID=UPI001BEC2981|nr:hypothetical protein [Streptomyces sp. ISL-11]MBT2386689.1 hypothetical protein [Streptomyces sp. ISL-11]
MTDWTERFETGYLSTVITRTANAYRWTHRAGTDRPLPMVAPTDAFSRAAGQASRRGVRFVLPWVETATDGSVALAYRGPGPRSLAAMLIAGEKPADAAGLLADASGCLSAFHAPVPDGMATRAPHGIHRLTGWMDASDGPRAAPAWHTLLRRSLGDERWCRIRAWCEEFARPQQPYIVHGAAGTGVIIPSADNLLQAGFLAGSEEAASHREFDLGWLLGELHESAALDDQDPVYLGELRDAFVSSYEGRIDERLLRIATTLRVIIHAHDFAAYLGWSRDLQNYTKIIVELVDTEGRCAFGAAAQR